MHALSLSLSLSLTHTHTHTHTHTEVSKNTKLNYLRSFLRFVMGDNSTEPIFRHYIRRRFELGRFQGDVLLCQVIIMLNGSTLQKLWSLTYFWVIPTFTAVHCALICSVQLFDTETENSSFSPNTYSYLLQYQNCWRTTYYYVKIKKLTYVCIVSRFGLAVGRSAGKQRDLGSNPLRLSLLF